MKNCDPLVPGPAFAIDRVPGPDAGVATFHTHGAQGTGGKGHRREREGQCTSVLELEVLVIELLAVDRLSAGAIAPREIATLR